MLSSVFVKGTSYQVFIYSFEKIILKLFVDYNSQISSFWGYSMANPIKYEHISG